MEGRDHRSPRLAGNSTLALETQENQVGIEKYPFGNNTLFIIPCREGIRVTAICLP